MWHRFCVLLLYGLSLNPRNFWLNKTGSTKQRQLFRGFHGLEERSLIQWSLMISIVECVDQLKIRLRGSRDNQLSTASSEVLLNLKHQDSIKMKSLLNHLLSGFIWNKKSLWSIWRRCCLSGSQHASTRTWSGIFWTTFSRNMQTMFWLLWPLYLDIQSVGLCFWSLV